MAYIGKCSFCEKVKKIQSRGMCKACYVRAWRNGGTPRDKLDRRKVYEPSDNLRICIKCNRLTRIEGRGLCSPCYQQAKKTGEYHLYKKQRAAWREEKREEILALYSEFTAKEIGDKLGLSRLQVLPVLWNAQVQMRPAWGRRKHELNLEAFNDLDNEYAAYWLGFIYADGHASGTALQIELKTGDRSHLEKLCLFLETDEAVKETKRDTVYLRVNSVELSRKLLELGIVTGRNEFWRTIKELPESQYSSFIRGFIDGDGHISNLQPLIKICGQLDILEWVDSFFVTKLSTTPKKIRRLYSGKMYDVSYMGGKQIRRILGFLYSPILHVFLDRKLKNALFWLDTQESNR